MEKWLRKQADKDVVRLTVLSGTLGFVAGVILFPPLVKGYLYVILFILMPAFQTLVGKMLLTVLND